MKKADETKKQQQADKLKADKLKADKQKARQKKAQDTLKKLQESEMSNAEQLHVEGKKNDRVSKYKKKLNALKSKLVDNARPSNRMHRTRNVGTDNNTKVA
eukprot:3939992-Rhodomonas_salina.3